LVKGGSSWRVKKESRCLGQNQHFKGTPGKTPFIDAIKEKKKKISCCAAKENSDTLIGLTKHCELWREMWR